MKALPLQQPTSVSWRLVVNFTILSIVAACLIGMGKRSSQLPWLVSIAAVISVVGCDWLGWLKINRTLCYFGMLLGTAIALFGYWSDNRGGSGVSNLHAVANMLVYIQIPLMFQRRDPRVFEHWGIFLILQFVVAALLNDNVLFGILLIPSLMAVCSTSIALADYISRESANKSGPELPWHWSQILSGFLWERNRVSKSNGILMSVSPSTMGTLPVNALPGWTGGLVFGMAVVLFSVVFFFGLPRLHTGAFEGLGISKPLVGFSGRVKLEDFGELMQNNDLAFRMSIQESNSKRAFQPLEPPYIRGTIVDVYDRGAWVTSNEGLAYRDILLPNEIRDELRPLGDTYIVSIIEQVKLGSTQFSMPPFVRSKNSLPLKFNDQTWCLLNSSYFEQRLQARQRYQFETLTYQLARQSPYLFDVQDCLSRNDEETSDSRKPARKTWTSEIDPVRFRGLLALRNEILSSATSESPMEKALMLEDYLASSSEFKYSLLPKVDRKNGLDPIEDFAANHRTGHCQYFASTLAIMLRSIGLPSRIVIGFRPAEYNDVGGYFLVRQRHAHAWVEVHLDYDEIQPGVLDIPTSIRKGIWLRLDPTPTGEGSNAGGSLKNASRTGQSFEAMEQLWRDSFMEFDSRSQPEVVGFFGASGDGTISYALRAVERLMLQLQSRAFGGTELSTENRFSWQGGLLASAFAIVALAAYRLATRMQWSLRRGRVRNDSKERLRRMPSWALLQRMIKALARLGFQREPHQTLLEFVVASQKFLSSQPKVTVADVEGLRPVVDAFYTLRYGSVDELDLYELEALQATVCNLERFASQKRKFFSNTL